MGLGGLSAGGPAAARHGGSSGGAGQGHEVGRCWCPCDRDVVLHTARLTKPEVTLADR